MRTNTLGGNGKIVPGETGIGLDSPDVSGNRRTVASAISLNNGSSKDWLSNGSELGKLVSTELTTFEGLVSAKERPGAREAQAQWTHHL